jgi:hypothetical protein
MEPFSDSRLEKSGPGKNLQSRSIKIAWAITIGEAFLFGTLVWVFADYWLMLPVRYRVAGVVGLGSLATLGIIRLVRFYRRLSRHKESAG